MTHRKCITCRHFADAGFAGSGWCRHPERQRDALVMVRKNELGCNQGWKKDFWEPLAEASELSSQPAQPGFGVAVTSAELAATAMRVSPLHDHEDSDASGGQSREDIVVGQQPIMRGFNRRRSDLPPLDDRGVPLSRDPGEAIRRAHEAFRETVGHRPRREVLSAQTTSELDTENALAKQTRPRAGSDYDGHETSSAEVGTPVTETARRATESSPSDENPAITPASTGTDDPVELEDALASPSSRPSRWNAIPARTGDTSADHASTAAAPAEAAESPEEHPELMPETKVESLFTPQPPARPLRAQPDSLARHRWPPRNADDAGLFPPRHGAERTADRPSTASASLTDQGSTSRDVTALVDPNRREWQERWKANALLVRGDTGEGLENGPRGELCQDADGPLFSHRVPSSPAVGGQAVDHEETAAEPDANSEAMNVPAARRLPASGSRPSADDMPHVNAAPPPSRIDESHSDVPRVCMTCRDFRPAESGERGWCTNDWAFSHRTMVAAHSRPCQTTIGSWWLPHEAIWLETVNVQNHGLPTPLLDAYLGEPKERVARRRS